MKLELEAGERLLVKEMAEYASEGIAVKGAFVVLTDRRLVLECPRIAKKDGFMKALFGVKRAPSGVLHVAHEIRREDFEACAEDGAQMTFHDKNTGYAHVGFAIRSITPHATWKQRIERWQAGTLEPVP